MAEKREFGTGIMVLNGSMTDLGLGWDSSMQRNGCKKKKIIML
jgi:hypothetical protein